MLACIPALRSDLLPRRRGTGWHRPRGDHASAGRSLSAVLLTELLVGDCGDASPIASSASAVGHGDEDRVYLTDDLAPGENLVFAATGVTAGDLLQGVRFFGGGARTHSLVMAYQAKQVRFVDTVHMFDRDSPPRVRL